MQVNLAKCLLDSRQQDSSLALIEQSIAESNAIAAKPDGRIAGIHIRIVQKETLADVLTELGRDNEAKVALREANTLRAHLPPARSRDRR